MYVKGMFNIMLKATQWHKVIEKYKKPKLWNFKKYNQALTINNNLSILQEFQTLIEQTSHKYVDEPSDHALWQSYTLLGKMTCFVQTTFVIMDTLRIKRYCPYKYESTITRYNNY